jgi:hypothetical protein
VLTTNANLNGCLGRSLRATYIPAHLARPPLERSYNHWEIMSSKVERVSTSGQVSHMRYEPLSCIFTAGIDQPTC